MIEPALFRTSVVLVIVKKMRNLFESDVCNSQDLCSSGMRSLTATGSLCVTFSVGIFSRQASPFVRSLHSFDFQLRNGKIYLGKMRLACLRPHLCPFVAME